MIAHEWEFILVSDFLEDKQEFEFPTSPGRVTPDFKWRGSFEWEHNENLQKIPVPKTNPQKTLCRICEPFKFQKKHWIQHTHTQTHKNIPSQVIFPSYGCHF